MKRIIFSAFILVLAAAATGSAEVYHCSSCSGCTSAISQSQSGDEVILDNDISCESGTRCVEFGSRSGVVFNGGGFTISRGESGSYGIYLESSSNSGNTVKNVTITGFSRGIYLTYAGNNTIEDSTIIGNNTGIEFYSASGNTIDNCLVKQNFTGILVEYNSDENIIVNSLIVRNHESGISFFPRVGSGDPERNLVSNNIFENNTENDIEIKTILSEETRDLSGIEFYLNQDLECGQQANIIGCNCMGGNFWKRPDGSGYSETCTDTDSDGICDTPFTIAHGSAQLTDAYPLSEIPGGCCVNGDRDGDGFTSETCGGTDHDDDPLRCGADCNSSMIEVCDGYDNDGDGYIDGTLRCEDRIVYRQAIVPFAVADQSCVEVPELGKIFCFGGSGYGSNSYKDSIFEYDLETDELSPSAGVLPSGRSDLSCSYAPTTGKIYCFGGYSQQTICTAWNEYGGCIAAYAIVARTDEIVEFDPVTSAVTTLTTVLPTILESMEAEWNQNTETIFLIGGTSSIHAGNRDTIWEFVPEQKSIRTKAAVLPSPRFGHSCTPLTRTGKIYCFGGYGANGLLDEIVEYDPQTDSLQVMPTVLPEVIKDTACVEDTVDGLIYCIGGKESSSTYRDTILVYNPETGTLAENPSRLINGRFGHECVEQKKTGKITCFGGCRNVVNLRDIFTYMTDIPQQGDANDDDSVDLTDVLTTLKILTRTSQEQINLKSDVDKNRKYGLAEALYQLKRQAEE